MNDIRTNEEGAMLRPATGDAYVRRRAAEMALPQIKSWLRGHGPVEDSDEEIITFLMRFVSNSNGYEAAKEMERGGWFSDPGLVEIMNGGFIFDAHSELTRQWVRCLGMTLPLQLGQRVKCHMFGNEVEGEIVKRDEDLAQYGVRLPEDKEKCWHVFWAEEVKAVAEQESAA